MKTGYGEIYRCEFLSNSAEAFGLSGRTPYRVRFWKKGYTGAVTELNMGDDPFVLETGDKEDFGLAVSRATIQVYSLSQEIDAFYVDNEQDMGVTLEQQSAGDVWTRRFTGWLTPRTSGQKYGRRPGTLDIAATDGLGSLVDYPFYQYPFAYQYTGFNTLHDVIWTCLRWVGYEIPLYVSMHAYEESMTVSAAYNPFQHVKQLLTCYQKSNGDWLSCRDVLERVLQAFNCVLFQEDGVWKLLRRDEIALPNVARNWISYADSTVTTGTAFTENPLRVVGYKQNATPQNLRISIDQSRRRWINTYNYGDPVNLLKNGDFSGALNNWQTQGTWNGGPIGDGTEGNPFGLQIIGTSPADQQYNAYRVDKPWLPLLGPVYQEITMARKAEEITVNVRGQLLKYNQQPTHIIHFSGRYINQGVAGPKMRITVEVTNKGKAETYDLAQDGTWGSGSKAEHFLMFSNVIKDGSSQVSRPTTGESFTIQSVQGVPGEGDYKIQVSLYPGVILYNSTSPTSRITYRGLKIGLLDGESLELVSEQITAEPPGLDAQARKKEQKYETYMGDQTTGLGGAGKRVGALYREDGQTLTKRWVLNGATNRLQNHGVRGRLRLFGRQNRTVEGELKGDIRYSDVLSLSELGYTAMVYRVKRDYKRRVTAIKAIEISAVSAAPLTGSYINANGDKLPMGELEPPPVGTTEPPTYLPRQNGGGVTTTTSGILQAMRDMLAKSQKMQLQVIPPGGSSGGDMGGTIQIGGQIINVRQ